MRSSFSQVVVSVFSVELLQPPRDVHRRPVEPRRRNLLLPHRWSDRCVADSRFTMDEVVVIIREVGGEVGVRRIELVTAAMVVALRGWRREGGDGEGLDDVTLVELKRVLDWGGGRFGLFDEAKEAESQKKKRGCWWTWRLTVYLPTTPLLLPQLAASLERGRDAREREFFFSTSTR